MVEVEIMNAENEKTTTVFDLELAKRGAERLGECPGRLDMLEKLVGQPANERTRPLFDIVIALNKELMELRLKIERMESRHR